MPDSIYGYPVVETATFAPEPAISLGYFAPSPLAELFKNARLGDKVTLTFDGKKRDYVITCLDPIRLEPTGDWRDA